MLIFANKSRRSNMSRFVDPFTDVGFKIVFGKENQSYLKT